MRIIRSGENSKQHLEVGKGSNAFFNVGNLNILKIGQPTHVSVSAMNLTVTPPEIALHCLREVYPSVLCCDRHPIIVTIETSVTHLPTAESNYHYKNADAVSYEADEGGNIIPD